MGLLAKEYVHLLLSPTRISAEGTLEFTLCMGISVAGKEVLAVAILNVVVWLGGPEEGGTQVSEAGRNGRMCGPT